MFDFLELLKPFIDEPLYMFLVGFVLGISLSTIAINWWHKKQAPTLKTELSCAPKGIWGRIDVLHKNNKPIMVSCMFFNNGICKKDGAQCDLLSRFLKK